MKRYEKIYRNWHVHNVLAHPASHILRTIGALSAADFVHDETSPSSQTRGRRGRVYLSQCDGCGRFVIAKIYEHACDCGGAANER